MKLIHEIGLELRASAVCSQVRRIRYGHFRLNHALLTKHCTSSSLIQNIEFCHELVSESKLNNRPALLVGGNDCLDPNLYIESGQFTHEFSDWLRLLCWIYPYIWNLKLQIINQRLNCFISTLKLILCYICMWLKNLHLQYNPIIVDSLIMEHRTRKTLDSRPHKETVSRSHHSTYYLMACGEEIGWKQRILLGFFLTGHSGDFGSSEL